MWHRVVGSQVGRFAVVGGANTIVHCATYLSLWPVLPYLLAHVSATVVATLCSYLLNCRFTFGVRPNSRTLLLFPLSNLVMLGAGTGVVAVAVAGIGLDSRLAPVVGFALVPLSFLVSRAVLTERLPARECARTAGVGLAVAALSLLPVLANPSFYFWDDSAAQFLPMWHRLGERLLAGDWPLGLDLDAWMGGNLAAEALFGIWNPVHLLDFLLVVWIGDLAVAGAVVKIQFMALLGAGVFVLCRGYGAKTGAASVLAVALPLSGFVRYFYAGTWAGGLMGLAWLPWAWWALRLHGAGRMPVIVPWVLCYLCVSAGDPYAVLALCMVFAGVAWESGRARVALRRLGVAGLAVAATLPLIFGPVLAASAVGWRSGYQLFNSGQLVPGIGDLLTASMPAFLPHIQSFGADRMSVPATYFAWFAVPLLAWLDWRAVRRGWRQRACAILLAGSSFLLCIGPSNAWLFRWPLRHIAVLQVALAVLLAVALSAGLRTDRFRLRLSCCLGSVAAMGYLSFVAWPSHAPEQLVSLLLIGVLVAAVLALRTRALAVVLHVGTVCALVLQVLWFPANREVAVYNFPSDVDRLRAGFAHLRGGTVVQLARFDLLTPEQIASRSAWRQLLFGNMPAAAGLSSVVAYTGIGHRAMHATLCLSYYGGTCARAQDRLWGPAGVAEALKARHVVLQRRLREPPAVPPGWRISHSDPDVVVFSRNAPPPWPRGRLSVATGVRVLDDSQHGQGRETVRFAAGGQRGELVFARLAWPGYRATMSGRPVPAGASAAGLLRVEVPPGTSGTLTLTWSPPGFTAELLSAVAGLALAVALSLPRRRSC